jgi:hypothetical protein
LGNRKWEIEQLLKRIELSQNKKEKEEIDQEKNLKLLELILATSTYEAITRPNLCSTQFCSKSRMKNAITITK